MRKLFFFAMFGLMASFHANAQLGGLGNVAAKAGVSGPVAGRVESLASQVKLNDSQKAQLQQLLTQSVSKLKDLKTKSNGNVSSSSPELASLKAEHAKGIKAILTPDQLASLKTSIQNKLKSQPASAPGSTSANLSSEDSMLDELEKEVAK